MLTRDRYNGITPFVQFISTTILSISNSCTTRGDTYFLVGDCIIIHVFILRYSVSTLYMGFNSVALWGGRVCGGVFCIYLLQYDSHKK